MRRRDVDLDHDQVGRVVEVERLDVLVLNLDLVVVVQVAGQRGQAERREQRVLDRPPERARRLGQRRQDHLDLHRAASPRTSTEISRVARAVELGQEHALPAAEQQPAVDRRSGRPRAAAAARGSARGRWRARPAVRFTVRTRHVVVPVAARRRGAAVSSSASKSVEQQRLVLVDDDGRGRVQRLDVDEARSECRRRRQAPRDGRSGR